MFIELRQAEEGGDPIINELGETDRPSFPVLVNVERVMWAAPLQDGTSRLYMNVADDAGIPAELDVLISYDELKPMLIAKGEHYENETKDSG